MRRHRADAARALVADARRAQVTWDDLSAWPDWAALDADARHALAVKAGAWLHAGDLQACIAGAVLQRVQALLGESEFRQLMNTPEAALAGQPLPADIERWLHDRGLEALLASVPSPVLRVVLREQFAPRSLPPLPALDGPRARRAVAQARR